MTNSEQIVASLINNNKITGEEAVVLFRAIYGKEKATDTSTSTYWKSNSELNNLYKHTDVLCASASINTISDDNAITAVSYSSDM